MEAILRLILDRRLRDFQGTEIKGSLAVSDDLVNEVLAEWLAGATGTPSPASETNAEPAAAATPPIDPRQLLSWLTIRQLRYHTEAGRTVVDLDVGV